MHNISYEFVFRDAMHCVSLRAVTVNHDRNSEEET
jgi:hypothetical protein